jgi:hypothetical protein
MIETSEETTLSGQLKTVLRDAAGYFGSAVSLVQARLIELLLSSATFLSLLALAFILVLAGLVILNVALGVWLTHVLGSTALGLLVMGVVYILLAAIAGGIGLRWLSRLKS